jgi:hypothetical protein
MNFKFICHGALPDWTPGAKYSIKVICLYWYIYKMYICPLFYLHYLYISPLVFFIRLSYDLPVYFVLLCNCSVLCVVSVG